MSVLVVLLLLVVVTAKAEGRRDGGFCCQLHPPAWLNSCADANLVVAIVSAPCCAGKQRLPRPTTATTGKGAERRQVQGYAARACQTAGGDWENVIASVLTSAVGPENFLVSSPLGRVRVLERS